MIFLTQPISRRIVQAWYCAEEGMWQAWRWGLTHLPSACALCGNWPAGPICADCCTAQCAAALRCPSCALVSTTQRSGLHGVCNECLETPPPWHACHAAVSYSLAWSGLMHRFKSGDVGLSRLFAARMLALAPLARAIADADLLVPVPSHTHRLLERGYNPAYLLAKQLCRHKTHAHLLLRSPLSQAQRGQSRQARLTNRSLTFSVAPGANKRLAGSSVLLIDDVMTTGATLHAAAQALQQGGARQIGAMVFARTEKVHPRA